MATNEPVLDEEVTTPEEVTEPTTDEVLETEPSEEVEKTSKKSSKKTKKPEVEKLGKVTTTPVDADEVDSDYPKSIPQGEGVDPLTSGVKIPNVEPDNQE